MTTNDTQEKLAKLQEELKEFKEKHPEEYLNLLKTLNDGMTEIADELEGAIRG